MKLGLLALVFGIAAHAGPLLEASGSGTYYYGEGIGNPIWEFSIAGAGCEEAGLTYCNGDDHTILAAVAGQQVFTITEFAQGQIVGTQEYQTFGTITSNTCTPLVTSEGVIPEYMCSEVFSFSPVAQALGSVIAPALLGQTNGVAPAAVPEPGSWLLITGGLLLLCRGRRIQSTLR